MYNPVEHAKSGLELLENLWTEVIEADVLDSENTSLNGKIDAILGGKEVGYKKAIIIQLVGKAADFSLDAQCLQRGSGQKGSRLNDKPADAGMFMARG